MKTDSTYGQVLHLPERLSKPASRPVARVQKPATLTDLLPSNPFDTAATGFALASLNTHKAPVLWVQDRQSRQENGTIYTPGLQAYGLTAPILHVMVNHPRDVLWAMEEGAQCAGLSAVIGEIHGAPKVLDFTATKRLAMRAEASGVAVYLIRSGDPGTLRAARERWRIGALPSATHPHDARAPGQARWDADLFRARGRAPSRWVASYDPSTQHTQDRLSLVPRPDAGAVETGDPRIQDRAGG